MRRLLLIGLSVVASSGLGIAETYARDAQDPVPTNVETDGDSLEEVTVTGTRVARAGFDAPTPLTSLSTDQLAAANPGGPVETMTRSDGSTASV